jgi:hypothetical protein
MKFAFHTRGVAPGYYPTALSAPQYSKQLASHPATDPANQLEHLLTTLNFWQIIWSIRQIT